MNHWMRSGFSHRRPKSPQFSSVHLFHFQHINILVIFSFDDIIDVFICYIVSCNILISFCIFC